MRTPTPAGGSPTRRCPSCGGLNPPGAEWCGQCLTRFDAQSGDPGLRPANTGARGAEHVTTAEPVRRGVFQVVGAEVMWSCTVCGHDNPLDAGACQTCAASFADVIRRDERPRLERDPNTAALYSLFLPGAGHAYVGLMGQAIARAVMSIWVVGVALVAVLSGPGRASALISVTYGLAAVGLWLAAAHDSYREAMDQPGLCWLSGRRFLYVTVALIAVLFTVITFGAIAARSAGGG